VILGLVEGVGVMSGIQTRKKTRKAWRVQLMNMTGISSADTRSKARMASYRVATELGYGIHIKDIRVTRAPEYDEWAATHERSSSYDESLMQRGYRP
jgi:hypothetical protein